MVCEEPIVHAVVQPSAGGTVAESRIRKLQLRTDEGVHNGIDAVVELVPHQFVASGTEAPPTTDAYLRE
jgi:hypothetical protein